VQDYIRKILTARVYDVAMESLLDPMPRLSQRLGSTVRLKREDLQPVFSFKLRGAYAKMVSLGRLEGAGRQIVNAQSMGEGVKIVE
jgi:threonine dehydratase